MFMLIIDDESTIMQLRRITPHKRVGVVHNAARSTGYPALKPQHLGCLRLNAMKGTLEVPVRITNEVSAKIVEAYTKDFLAHLRSSLLAPARPATPPKDAAWR